jgi:N6-adenosine-specific RNA methylase IME4
MDALQLRDNAKQQLAEIKTIETGVEYLNKVKAIETWAKAEKKDAELQNLVAEQKLRTQRILGGLLKNEVKAGNPQLSQASTIGLSEFGISRNESSSFQKIASLPQQIFEEEISTAKEETSKRIELSTSRLLKVAKKIEREQDLKQQKKVIDKLNYSKLLDKYDVLVVDPPWEYKRTYDPDASRVANPYPSMSLEEIKNVNLPNAKDSILWLWSTQAYLYEAKNILEHWGYEYKATLVWNKDNIGMGNWLRMQCEFCLLGIKGKPIYHNTKYRDIITEKGREHSRKPESFYNMVNDICIGTKLDYFSREKRKGWYSYGNEIDKF